MTYNFTKLDFGHVVMIDRLTHRFLLFWRPLLPRVWLGLGLLDLIPSQRVKLLVPTSSCQHNFFMDPYVYIKHDSEQVFLIIQNLRIAPAALCSAKPVQQERGRRD
jgi:hypothetical protein